MKFLLALTIGFLISLPVFAGSRIGNMSVQVQEYTYDFAVHGGAIGQIDLATAAKSLLPVGAVVTSVHYKVITAPTSSGSATIALGDVASGARYKAATAYNDAAYAIDFVAAAAIGVPMNITAANNGKFAITIATAALTAGKIKFFVSYLMPKS
jgi:hypothetical protein